jgi:peroxidase
MATAQIVFLREHNKLAEGLAKVNPSWNDERLYQEARRILIAQAQHITYNEWLPVIIGRKKMQELGLLPLQSGFSQSYDANLNPAILNEFVTAAFRFGHSQVQGSYRYVYLYYFNCIYCFSGKFMEIDGFIFIFSLFNQQRQKVGTDKILRQHFFKSQEVYTPGNVDKFLISLSTTPVQNVDNSFTVEVYLL